MPSLRKRMAMRARADAAGGAIELGQSPFGYDPDAPAVADGVNAPFMARQMGNHLAVLPLLLVAAVYAVLTLGVAHPIAAGAVAAGATLALGLIVVVRFNACGSEAGPGAVTSCVVAALLVGGVVSYVLTHAARK